VASFPQPAGHEPRDTGLAKSVLELAPLELECMNTLWPLGEATVRDIQQQLAPSLPRAYTTIMTIMDRLAHKGVVSRRKSGRAWLYCPNLSAEEARSRAVSRLVDGFFEGSPTALAAHLSSSQVSVGAPLSSRPSHPARPRAASESEAVTLRREPDSPGIQEPPRTEEPALVVSRTRLDDSLL